MLGFHRLIGRQRRNFAAIGLASTLAGECLKEHLQSSLRSEPDQGRHFFLKNFAESL